MISKIIHVENHILIRTIFPNIADFKQQFILKALQLMLQKNYTGDGILQTLERKTKHGITEIY